MKTKILKTINICLIFITSFFLLQNNVLAKEPNTFPKESLLKSISISSSKVFLTDNFNINIFIEKKLETSSPSEGGGVTDSNTCDYIFGGYNNPEYLGYYMVKLLDAIKIMGPILVIVMTIVDLVKVIALGKPDELNKLAVKSLKRIIYAVLLFIIPVVLDWGFKLFSVYGVCLPE